MESYLYASPKTVSYRLSLLLLSEKQCCIVCKQVYERIRRVAHTRPDARRAAVVRQHNTVPKEQYKAGV